MVTFLHHDGALGDVMLSLPCLRRILAGNGSVHFAGRDDVGVLLRESGLVTETSSAACARYLSLHGCAADDDARAFLSRFVRAYIVTVAPDGPFVHALRSIIPATRVIRSLPPEGNGSHIAQFRLGQLGNDTAQGGVLLPVPPLHRDLAAGMLSRAGYDGTRPIIVVHPGSGSRAKNWPFDRYEAMIDTCRAHVGPFVVLFSGPAEDEHMRDRIDDFVRSRSGMVHYAAADLSAVAALLHAADLYVGNDSGVSHLAAAVGCRTIVLFGPTDPVRWRPVGAMVEVLRSEALADISVEEVVRSVLQALGHSARIAPDTPA